MLEGTIIEKSLRDSSVLKTLHTIQSWTEEDWRLHQVRVTRAEAIRLGQYLDDGPWYMHFWENGSDDVLVVFADSSFDIKYSDKSTWKEAIEHGKKKGIPEEQLDFNIV